MRIGFVAGDQAGFILVQVPLQEHAVIDHALELLADEFGRSAHLPRQLIELALGLAAQNAQIFFKPPHPLDGADAVCKQPHAAAQHSQRQSAQHGKRPAQAGDQGNHTAADDAPGAEQRHDAAAHGFDNAPASFPVGFW